MSYLSLRLTARLAGAALLALPLLGPAAAEMAAPGPEVAGASVPGVNALDGVPCPTSKTCVYVQRIGCYQAKACYALGGSTTAVPARTNEPFPLNPKTGAIGKVVHLGTFSGDSIACTSGTICLVAGFTGSGARDGTPRPG